MLFTQRCAFPRFSQNKNERVLRFCHGVELLSEGTALFPEVTKNLQIFQQSSNLFCSPLLQVSTCPSSWFWVAKSKLQTSLVICNLETLNSPYST